MKNKNYNLGLLYMIHLLISSDGEVSRDEEHAWEIIKQKEGISEDTFGEFRKSLENKKEREIYQAGIDYLNLCTNTEKLDAFSHLYRLSEADGNVHVKEVRLLLYSIRMTGIEFNDVVDHAKKVV
ncbi:MAG: TerB family tellurite resistance protein [Bacteroidota bacterium]